GDGFGVHRERDLHRRHTKAILPYSTAAESASAPHRPIRGAGTRLGERRRLWDEAPLELEQVARERAARGGIDQEARRTSRPVRARQSRRATRSPPELGSPSPGEAEGQRPRQRRHHGGLAGAPGPARERAPRRRWGNDLPPATLPPQ